MTAVYVVLGGLALVALWSVLAYNALGDASGINASPALSQGQLSIRSNRYLYCIGAQR